MSDQKIILAGLANNKTSLGEVFRRNIDCFKDFCTPDVYDLSSYVKNDEFKLDLYPQFEGKVDHNFRYFHTTFHLYNAVKKNAVPKPRTPDIKKVGYFVWESSQLQDYNIPVLQDFDEIWTASNYCKDIFSQYVDPSIIKVVPHPIDVPSRKIMKYSNYTILLIGNISSNVDRKNMEGNIAVAKIIKEKYPDINIIFKTFTVSNAERTVLRKLIGNSKIKVIDQYYTSEKVQELVARCHMVLSLHRSEGFGLTLAEAMAVGTVPVATGYSGNTDFMKNPRLLVDYDIVDITSPYFKGQWANPRNDDAIDKISAIIEKPIETDFLKEYVSTHLRPSVISSTIYHLVNGKSEFKSTNFITNDYRPILNHYNKSEKADNNFFEVEDIINPQEKDRILSMSLFFKHKGSRPSAIDLSEEIIRNESPKAWDKYFTQITEFGPTYAKEHPDTKIRIYLAQDCKFMIPRLEDFCEIHLMKSSSVCENPGALWRYLPMEDGGNNVYWDIDAMNRTQRLRFLFNSRNAFARFFSDSYDVNDNIVCRALAGGSFKSSVKLPIKDMMQSFIREALSKSITSSLPYDDRDNVPFFGRYWPHYGFDEWFLLNFIYPIALEKGMDTFISKDQINGQANPMALFDLYKSRTHKKNRLIVR